MLNNSTAKLNDSTFRLNQNGSARIHYSQVIDNERTAIVFALAASVPYRATSHASTTLRKGESSNGKNQGKEKFRKVESSRSLIAWTRGSWRNIQQRQPQLYRSAAAD